MSGRELDTNALMPLGGGAEAHRGAAVRCADWIAARYPHELDQLMPKLAGRTLAKEPDVRADLLELLDAIGYTSKERT